jgi:hypothetical protein
MADAPRIPTRRQLLLAAMAAAGGLALGQRKHSWLPASSAHPTNGATMADNTATIALGDPKLSYLGATDTTIDRKPVGIDFHEHDWPFDQLGTVRYAQGPYSFELPLVSGIMGSYDRDKPEQGFYAWSITAFPMAGETIPHAQARDKLFRFFASLLTAGWRRYISVSDPRLSGDQTMRYFVEQGGGYFPDPAYVPTLDEWMQLNEDLPCWRFWADGSYMMVRVIDEPSLRNPARPGVYMFDINIRSESSNSQRYFTKVADMKRWKELLPAELHRLHQIRKTREIELQRRGYLIDTSYEDPPILALQRSA